MKHQLIFQLSENAVSSIFSLVQVGQKTNDFPQANMISKSRNKHWNTMNQSQNGMKIFQKKHPVS